MKPNPFLRLRFGIVAMGIILLASTSTGQTNPSAAVTIIVHTESGMAFGSGAFVSGDGLVLTAYHVVQGATSIEIISNGRLVVDDGVTVETINPDQDLATLSVRDPQLRFGYYPLAVGAPSPNDILWIVGFIAGLPNQSLQVRTTQMGFALSRRFLSPDGSSIFANKGVDIIPINTTIYRGMSGAPLLWNGKAVGVISGSINEGGTFAWAIPTEYLNGSTTQSVHKRAADIKWPALRLMDSRWGGLRRELAVNKTRADDVDTLLTTASDLINIVDNRFQPVRDSYTRGIANLRAWINLVPVSENQLKLRDSPSYTRIRDRFLAAVDGLGDTGSKFADLDDDFVDALNDIDQSIKSIDEVLTGMQGSIKARELRSALRQLSDQMLANEAALNNDPCASAKPEVFGGPDVKVYTGHPDEDENTVGQLRQALASRCALLIDTYFSSDKKIAQVITGMGGTFQDILEQDILVVLESSM